MLELSKVFKHILVVCLFVFRIFQRVDCEIDIILIKPCIYFNQFEDIELFTKEGDKILMTCKNKITRQIYIFFFSLCQSYIMIRV